MKTGVGLLFLACDLKNQNMKVAMVVYSRDPGSVWWLERYYKPDARTQGIDLSPFICSNFDEIKSCLGDLREFQGKNSLILFEVLPVDFEEVSQLLNEMA